MQTKRMLLAASAAMVLSAATAQAGPCNTGGMSANRDAGSGPTVGVPPKLPVAHNPPVSIHRQIQ